MELNQNYDRQAQMEKEQAAQNDDRTDFRYYKNYDPYAAEITPDVYDVTCLMATVRRYPDKDEPNAYNEQLELILRFDSGADGIKNHFIRMTIWGARTHADGHSDQNPLRLQDFLTVCAHDTPNFLRHYPHEFYGGEQRLVYPMIAKMQFQMVCTFKGAKEYKGKVFDQFYFEMFSKNGFSAVELDGGAKTAQDIMHSLKKAQGIYAQIGGAVPQKPKANAFGGVQAQTQTQAQPVQSEPQSTAQTDDDIPF